MKPLLSRSFAKKYLYSMECLERAWITAARLVVELIRLSINNLNKNWLMNFYDLQAGNFQFYFPEQTVSQFENFVLGPGIKFCFWVRYKIPEVRTEKWQFENLSATIPFTGIWYIVSAQYLGFRSLLTFVFDNISSIFVPDILKRLLFAALLTCN